MNEHKDNWKANSKLEYLQQGLEYFIAHYKEGGIKSIAFPKLGAQNGKLSWDEVGPLMVKYLSQADIDVYIYIADGDKEYFPINDHAEKVAWQRFNELALSSESLIEVIQLSERQAKKVFEKRQSLEFTSFADIQTIENLAKVSLQRIKDYINSQVYPPNQLPGMSAENKVSPNMRKSKETPQKRKVKNKPRREVDRVPLPL